MDGALRPETDWILLLRILKITLSDRFSGNVGMHVYRQMVESSEGSSDLVSFDSEPGWRMPFMSTEAPVYAALSNQVGTRWTVTLTVTVVAIITVFAISTIFE